MHVNYQIRWKNFRGFKDTGWITIKPITMLIGANNSGKSSLIAPLLLLKQTLSSRGDAISPLVTRGNLIDVGSYKDFVFNNKDSLDISFGLRIHIHEKKKKKNIQRVGVYPPGSVNLIFGHGDKENDIFLKKIEINDMYDRPYLKRTRLKSGKYSLTGLSLNKMKPHERKAVQETRPMNYLFTPESVLYAKRHSKEDDKSSKESFSKDFQHYLRIVSYTFSMVSGFFNDVTYIGPLRENPKRYYEISGEKPRTVGIRGENAANLLQAKNKKWQRAINKWIRLFEFGDVLKINRLADDIFSIELENKEQKKVTNFADVGFGASQLLPLIVQAMAADSDSLTIAEQPEIHLNPRLQCNLADLFVEMAKNDHGILVETHSEHLLLRLRQLIAKNEIDNSDVVTYYIERGVDGSVIRKVPIAADGHIDIDDWPKGFFQDALRESLVLASLQK